MIKHITLVLALALLIVPGVASASTDVDDSQGDSCARITVNLRYGMRDTEVNGNAVSVLQDFLYSNGYLSLAPTGFFGSMTRNAVASFQSANGIQASPAGFVGSVTRARIQSIDCDGSPIEVPTKPVPVPTPKPVPLPTIPAGPVIDSVQAKASDPGTVYAGEKAYIYGDRFSAPMTVNIGGYLLNATYTSNSYAEFVVPSSLLPGQVRMYVTNPSGLSSTAYPVSVVGRTEIGAMKVTSPNGGETWQKGSLQTIKWSSYNECNPSSVCPTVLPWSYDVKIKSACISSELACTALYSPEIIVRGVSSNSYTWTVGDLGSGPNQLGEGAYQIVVCLAATDICDMSDSYFKIVDVPPPPLTLTSPNGGETLYKGNLETIRWTHYVTHVECPEGAYCTPPPPRTYDIKIKSACISNDLACTALYSPEVIVRGVYGNSYAWTVGDLGSGPNQLGSGAYQIVVCHAATDTCDMSDSYFKISEVTIGRSNLPSSPDIASMMQSLKYIIEALKHVQQ